MKGVRMNKSAKIIIALLLSSQMVMAVQVYSTEKLNDGTCIRKCRYDNGKIDYCTQKDALKAIEVFNNPWKYMTPAQKAQWEKNERDSKAREEANKKAVQAEKLKFQNEFPVAKKIETTLNAYKKEYNELSRKSNLGLPFDEERFAILESKINILKELYGESAEYTNPYVTGYSSLTITGIQGTYNNLSDKLKKKEITQDEFNYIKAKLVINAGQLETTYNKVLNSQGKVLYAGESQSDNQNLNNGTATQININDTKLDKARKGLGTGVNILNDTMNSVRSIQSMFGI